VKNKLSDLNNHLFAQLERLSDEDLPPEKVEQEVARSDALVAVARIFNRDHTTILHALRKMGVERAAAGRG